MEQRPTLTHALSSFSPAVDSGIDLSAGPFDQRGEPRSDGDGDGNAVSDSGAFEATKASLSAAGTVHAGDGFVTDALTMNGSAGGADRCVAVPVDTSITVHLSETPAGSGAGRYLLYAWLGSPTTATPIDAGGVRLGCMVDAVPIGATAGTLPFRCLRSPGIPQAVCRNVREMQVKVQKRWPLVELSRSTRNEI